MKNFVILSHSSGLSGPIDYLEDYLTKAGDLVYKIEHPLDHYVNRFSHLYLDKKLIKNYKRLDIGTLPNLFTDLILNICLLAKIKKKEIIIGANNWDTFSGLLYKFLFWNPNLQVIYFASDYAPNRFQNKIVNKLYLYIEKIGFKIFEYNYLKYFSC